MAIGWVDFSKEDRDKVLSVMALLQEDGAVDELGIGTIRDAFADQFFPGTSTVQTRAKYFLVIAYELYEVYLGKYIGQNVDEIVRDFDDKEKKYAIGLKNNNPPATTGIIGSRNLPYNWVARKPYEIYWKGLCTYNIFRNRKISFREFIAYALEISKKKHSAIDFGNSRDKDSEDGTADDIDSVDTGVRQLLNLPESYDKNWRKNTDINLTLEEASFLKRQMCSDDKLKKSLLGYILIHNVKIDLAGSFEELVELVNDGIEDQSLRELLDLAVEFNKLVYLATLRFNCILFEGENKNVENEWEENSYLMEELHAVDMRRIAEVLHLRNSRLYVFLTQLKRCFVSKDIEAADKLITAREESLKGAARAKLRHKEDYKDNKWVGIKKLDYRFKVTRNLIKDIYVGLGVKDV